GEVALPRAGPVGEADVLLALVVRGDPDLVARPQIYRGGDEPYPGPRPFEKVLIPPGDHAEVGVEGLELRRLDAAAQVPVGQPVRPGERNGVHHAAGMPLDRIPLEEIGIVLERLRKEERTNPPAALELEQDAVVVLEVATPPCHHRPVIPRAAEGDRERPALERGAWFAEE